MSSLKSFWIIIISVVLSSCTNEQSKTKEEKLTDTQIIIQNQEQVLLEEYVNQEYKQFVLPHSDSIKSIAYSGVHKIISNNCVFCHKPDGNAPFSLMNYKDVQKRVHTIREVLSTKRMPPWMADNSYSHLFNAPKITDSERAQIIHWIDRGAKKDLSADSEIGNSNAPVKRPEIIADLELNRAEEFTITTNKDSYECFIYEIENDSDFYLSGVEFISSNPEVIHHQMLFLDTANIIKTKESCWDCKNDGIINKCVPISSWSKGMRPFVLNKKLAYKIPKGSKFILQTHYGDEGNKGRQERTRLKLFKSNDFEEIVNYTILNKLDIFYPKGEVLAETLTHKIEEKTSIIAITPHSHFLTKKMEVYAITPDKKIIPLLKIPEWDYLWQGDYIFETPVVLPKGALVVFSVVIDNTKSNPTQPNFPVRDVSYATNSDDEMLCLVLIKKPYKQGDEELKLANYIN